MKKLYFLFSILCAGLITVAQTSNAGRTDPEAKKILDGVSAKFKTFKTVAADFTYQVQNADGKTLGTEKGKVYMKGNKYYISSGDQEVFSDGKNVWTLDKSANEVTITTLDDAPGSLTPQKLFTNFYDKDFIYKLNGEKKSGTKVIQEIEMTPTDKTRPYHKIYVQVDKASKLMSGTRVLEKSGNRYVYTIISLKPNAAVSDAQFIFNKAKYPGVEVIDLR